MASHIIPQHAKAIGKQGKLIPPNLGACCQRVTQDDYRQAIAPFQRVSDFAIVDCREFSLHDMEDFAAAWSLRVLRANLSALHNRSGKVSEAALVRKPFNVRMLLRRLETNLHGGYVHEKFVMLAPIKSIAALLVFVLIAWLTSCQGGVGGGNATSKGEVTDPNAAFSRAAKQSP
jgi:hypothetical protein